MFTVPMFSYTSIVVDSTSKYPGFAENNIKIITDFKQQILSKLHNILVYVLCKKDRRSVSKTCEESRTIFLWSKGTCDTDVARNKCVCCARFFQAMRVN